MYMNVPEVEARIYTLSDPRTGAIRYVGMTVSPLKKRLGGHLRYKGTDHKSCWVRSLRAIGLKPVITEVEIVPVEERVGAEQRWIAHYREQGADLTNSTKGGVGSLGYRHTEEAKALMSIQRRGQPRPKDPSIYTAEVRERLRQAGIRQFQEHPERREAVSRVHKGKTISEEQRRAVSEASKKRWQEWRESGQVTSPETRAKISAARKGKKQPPLSVEARARIAEAKRKWWAEKKAREGGMDGTRT